MWPWYYTGHPGPATDAVTTNTGTWCTLESAPTAASVSVRVRTVSCRTTCRPTCPRYPTGNSICCHGITAALGNRTPTTASTCTWMYARRRTAADTVFPDTVGDDISEFKQFKCSLKWQAVLFAINVTRCIGSDRDTGLFTSAKTGSPMSVCRAQQDGMRHVWWAPRVSPRDYRLLMDRTTNASPVIYNLIVWIVCESRLTFNNRFH